MSIYHLSVKPLSRSKGRSATAAAAYRAACRIDDSRSGICHDFRRKKGVVSTHLVLPIGAPDWASDRAQLWNQAELIEKRKDACTAREFEVALPAELTVMQREALALKFASEMTEKEGCAVDVCIHAPSKSGDTRNHHAHILRSTRQITPTGFGNKLVSEQAGRDRKHDLEHTRARWAELINEALLNVSSGVLVDHRSHARRGIDTAPSAHLGPAGTWKARRLLKRYQQVSTVTPNSAPRAVDKLAVMRSRLKNQKDLLRSEHTQSEPQKQGPQNDQSFNAPDR